MNEGEAGDGDFMIPKGRMMDQPPLEFKLVHGTLRTKAVASLAPAFVRTECPCCRRRPLDPIDDGSLYDRDMRSAPGHCTSCSSQAVQVRSRSSCRGKMWC